MQPMIPARARRRSAPIWVALLLAASTACVDLLPTPIFDFPPCDKSCYTVEFMIYPFQLNILRGDSAELFTSSTTGRDDATWSSSGNSAALIRPDGALDSAITIGQRKAWVKARRSGRGAVRAQAVSAQFADTSDVLVVDSSEMFEIRANGIDLGTPLKVGVAAILYVVLVNNHGEGFHGAPTSWSVSDTALADIAPPFLYNEQGTRFTVTPKMAGSGTLTFAFLGLRKSVAFRVAP